MQQGQQGPFTAWIQTQVLMVSSPAFAMTELSHYPLQNHYIAQDLFGKSGMEKG